MKHVAAALPILSLLPIATAQTTTSEVNQTQELPGALAWSIKLASSLYLLDLAIDEFSYTIGFSNRGDATIERATEIQWASQLNDTESV